MAPEEQEQEAERKAEWRQPELVELDIRSTEMNSGAGGDGGSFPNTAS